jgi:hypothetical protein
MDGIKNKIKESGLIQLDLSIFKPKLELFHGIDLSEQLWQGLVLKEKDFRLFIESNDWNLYQDKYVYIHCSADAIIPTWAYMLVAAKITGIARFLLAGSKLDLEKELIRIEIEKLDLSIYNDARVVIKGCADIVSPEYAMSLLVARLQPFVKSIMYGEPCSTVPVYKRRS